ncbi:MAG: type II toxin-antitoxin system VapC family toxin [Solirubrobacterales bacterium]
MAVALDSNAVIGFLDPGDTFHEAANERIRSLLGGGERLYASVVTYAEVLTGAKLAHHDEAIVVGFFDQLISEILPVDVPVAERAANLRGRKKALAMPDALILASADVHPEVDLIVSADGVVQGLEDVLRCQVDPLRQI